MGNDMMHSNIPTTDQTNYLTVVYQINDPISFEAEHGKIMDKLYTQDTPDSEVIPWCVVELSIDNEIHRLKLIEMAREEGKLELIGEILDICGIDQFTSLNQLSHNGAPGVEN